MRSSSYHRRLINPGWREVIHTWSIPDICYLLQTTTTEGLSSSTVKHILSYEGKNKFTLPKAPPQPWCQYIRNCFRYFGIIMFMCMSLSFLLYSMEFREVNYGEINSEHLFNGILLFLMFLFSGYLRFMSESDDYGVALAFKDLMPMFCTVIRDSQKQIIRADNLVLGDILMITYGERIAADVRIFSAQGLEINNVALTGISQPVVIIPKLGHPNKWWAQNVGFAGSLVMKGHGQGIVIACGDDTEIGAMAGVTMGERPKSLTNTLMQQVMFYTYVVCFIMLLVIIYSTSIIEMTFITMIEMTIGLALSLAPMYLPTLMFFGLRHIRSCLLKRGCLVRNMEAGATLGSTSVICSALIGTLTRNEWNVSEVFVEGRQLQGHSLSEFQKSEQFMNLIKVSVLCNDAYVTSGQRGVPENLKNHYGTYHDIAMLKYGKLIFSDVKKLRRDHELLTYTCYTRQDGMGVSVHCVRKPDGTMEYILLMKGKIQRVLRQCSTHRLSDGSPAVTLEKSDRDTILRAANALSDKGRYSIGFGYHVLSPGELRIIAQLTEDFSINNSRPFVKFLNKYDYAMHFMGFISVYDPPYDDIELTLKRCHTAGIKLVLLTRVGVHFSRAMAKLIGVIGPNSETVDDVSTRLKIPRSQVNLSMVTAAVVHMPSWEKKECHQRWEIRQLLLSYQDVVFANVAVAQRHMIVEECQELGAVVSMVGSSVHHTAAVRRAHVGVAEEASSEAVQHCSDLILIDGNFSNLVDAISESRLFIDNMKKAFAYALSSDVAMVTIPLIELLLRIPFRLFVITSLLLDLLVNFIPALAIFYETQDINLMKKKPRAFQDKLINSFLVLMIFLQVGLIQTSAVFLTYFACMGANGFLPRTLLGLRDDWYNESKNDLLDSYGQEWTYTARERLDDQICSATMFTLTTMQCVNLMLIKMGQPNLIKNVFRNVYMNIAVLYMISLSVAICFIDCPLLHMVPTRNYLFILKYIWPLGMLNVITECMRQIFKKRFPGGWLARFTYYG